MSSNASAGGPPFLNFSVGQATLKGEDVCFAHQPAQLPGADAGTLPWSMFAICDGHQGSAAAQFVQSRLWPLVQKRLPGSFPSLWEGAELLIFAEKVRSALIEAMDEVDTEWYNEERPSGTTATVALVSGWLLSVANVGDTCAILHTGDKVMEMTRSHRLDDCPDERKRLSESGAHLASLGYLLKGPAEPGENGIGPLRVWPGGLAVGRSIGDTDVSPHVLPLPHVRQIIIPATGARLLVASDGLWDHIVSRKIYKACRDRSLRKCTSHLVRVVGRAGGGEFKDDLTVMVVDMLPTPQQDFKNLVAERRKRTARYPGLSCLCMGPVGVDDPTTLLSDVDGLASRPPGTLRRKNTIKFSPDNVPESFPKPSNIEYSVHGGSAGSAGGEKSPAGGLSHKVIKVFSTASPRTSLDKGLPAAKKPPLARRKEVDNQRAQ